MRVEFLEEMIDSVGVGVGAYDETGKFRYVNRAYSELFGLDPEALVGVPIWGVNDAVDPDRFDGYWGSFTDGETRTAEAVHEYEGTAVEVGTLTTRVTIDGLSYNIGTIKDITLRKTRERQLGQLHGVTRELIESDSSEEIAEITVQAARSVLGYQNSIVWFVEQDDVLRPAVLTEPSRANVADHPGYALEGDSPAVRTYERGEALVVDNLETIEDDYERGEARSAVYLPLGKYGIVSIANDEGFRGTDVDLASILVSNAETALRRLESEQTLKRQNQRLEAFVDVISHDIPNHLNVAATRLELAEAGESEHVDHVKTAHERIESVIADMRTLVDQGKQIDETVWNPLGEVARSCLYASIESEEVATLDVVDDGYVNADESRLKQLFENLFWNAIEYAGPEPTIQIGLHAEGFYFEDDGPGIPPEDRERVLSPAFTTAEGGHSGFGLAIVREIARAHGWEVEVSEGTEGGARFEFAGTAVRPE